MPQGRLFYQPEINLKKLEELNDALTDLNQVSAQMFFVFGMTDAVKRLCDTYYKMLIFILEAMIEEWRLLKESHEYTNTHVDYIARLAEHEADLEQVKEDYEYFKEYGEIR